MGMLLGGDLESRSRRSSLVHPEKWINPIPLKIKPGIALDILRMRGSHQVSHELQFFCVKITMKSVFYGFSLGNSLQVSVDFKPFQRALHGLLMFVTCYPASKQQNYSTKAICYGLSMATRSPCSSLRYWRVTNNHCLPQGIHHSPFKKPRCRLHSPFAVASSITIQSEFNRFTLW